MLPTENIDLSAFKAKPPDVIYTPQNWGSNHKALYAITFQANKESQLTSEKQGVNILSPYIAAGHNTETQMNMFVFDAIKRASHRQFANVTQHPLQTGFNIADHVIKQPITLTLEVGMSDAIASYSVAGYIPMWELNPSKSVSAYQQMVGLMDLRQIMNINTRLQTYYNMVLTDVSSEDSHRTYFGGLAMTLTFQQVFITDTSVSYDANRIQSTKETKQGTVQPLPPSKVVEDTHKVGWGTPSAPLIIIPGTIPGSELLSGLANMFAKTGAGFWSSAMTGLGQAKPVASPF